jgi:hypothetical protein
MRGVDEDSDTRASRSPRPRDELLRTMEPALVHARAALDWLLHTQTGQLVALATVLFYVLAWWRIFSRVGYPGALALLMLVPPLAVLLWAFLALAPWPARRELAALRRVQRVVHQAERRRLIG